jgi:hypothetical protein
LVYQDFQTGAGKDALLLRSGLAAALKEARAASCPLMVSRPVIPLETAEFDSDSSPVPAIGKADPEFPPANYRSRARSLGDLEDRRRPPHSPSGCGGRAIGYSPGAR